MVEDQGQLSNNGLKIQPNDRIVKVLSVGTVNLVRITYKRRQASGQLGENITPNWNYMSWSYKQIKHGRLSSYLTAFILDRPKLANIIARLAQELGKCPELFIQVNTGAEIQKAGVLVKDFESFIIDCRAKIFQFVAWWPSLRR